MGEIEPHVTRSKCVRALPGAKDTARSVDEGSVGGPPSSAPSHDYSLLGPIGTHAPKKLEPTSRGFSVAAARERYRLLLLKHAEHIGAGGLREAKVIERKRRAAKEAAATERAVHSLARLLDDYVMLAPTEN